MRPLDSKFKQQKLFVSRLPLASQEPIKPGVYTIDKLSLMSPINVNCGDTALAILAISTAEFSQIWTKMCRRSAAHYIRLNLYCFRSVTISIFIVFINTRRMTEIFFDHVYYFLSQSFK